MVNLRCNCNLLAIFVLFYNDFGNVNIIDKIR